MLSILSPLKHFAFILIYFASHNWSNSTAVQNNSGAHISVDSTLNKNSCILNNNITNIKAFINNKFVFHVFYPLDPKKRYDWLFIHGEPPALRGAQKKKSI